MSNFCENTSCQNWEFSKDCSCKAHKSYTSTSSIPVIVEYDKNKDDALDYFSKKLKQKRSYDLKNRIRNKRKHLIKKRKPLKKIRC